MVVQQQVVDQTVVIWDIKINNNKLLNAMAKKIQKTSHQTNGSSHPIEANIALEWRFLPLQKAFWP